MLVKELQPPMLRSDNARHALRGAILVKELQLIMSSFDNA